MDLPNKPRAVPVSGVAELFISHSLLLGLNVDDSVKEAIEKIRSDSDDLNWYALYRK